MSGYIEYDNTSVYSPYYRRDIRVKDTTYESAVDAISADNDPYEVILIMVRDNRDVFYPYRNYTFQGEYSALLNRAINELYTPREEPIGVGRYIYIVENSTIHETIPVEYGIPVVRRVYTLDRISDRVYMQSNPLDVYERYLVYMIGDTPMYVGDAGVFLMLDKPDQDVSPILETLLRGEG